LGLGEEGIGEAFRDSRTAESDACRKQVLHVNGGGQLQPAAIELGRALRSKQTARQRA